MRAILFATLAVLAAPAAFAQDFPASGIPAPAVASSNSAPGATNPTLSFPYSAISSASSNRTMAPTIASSGGFVPASRG